MTGSRLILNDTALLTFCLRALLFGNAGRLLAQRRRDCLVLCFPRALSFRRRVASTNITLSAELLLYFNPASSLGVISPLCADESNAP